jgi:CubicO group peptidase (beta-lactamase class C family)
VSDVVNGTPVTPRTNFYTGSTTKAFTAAALALLVDDEKYQNVQWATPVNQLIHDDFVVADAWATDHLTLEDVLSHRTGLPHHDQSHGRPPATDESHDAPRAAVRDIVRQIRHLPLTAEPRTTFQYCNLMFVAAAHIIETLTGQWLGKFLRERIWEPLGMDGTYFATEDAKAASEPLAKGYRWDEHEEKYIDVPWMNLDGTSGAGSVISNVVDYSCWAQAVLEKAPPLSKRSWQELTTPRSLVLAQEPMTGPLTYALGWYGGIYKGHRFLEHTGAMNAYGAEFILFPDLKYAVVGFANTAGSSVFAERILLWRLIDDRLGIPLVERFDWNKKYIEPCSDNI